MPEAAIGKRGFHSFDAAPVPGSHVLALVDPPYYGTKGYAAGKSTVPLAVYRQVAGLLDRLKSANNHIVYNDEAWWLKQAQEKGKPTRLALPPDYGPDADAVLSGIRAGMDQFGLVPIKKRIETLGIYHARHELDTTRGIADAGDDGPGAGAAVDAGIRGVDSEAAGGGLAGTAAGPGGSVPAAGVSPSLQEAAAAASAEPGGEALPAPAIDLQASVPGAPAGSTRAALLAELEAAGFGKEVPALIRAGVLKIIHSREAPQGVPSSVAAVWNNRAREALLFHDRIAPGTGVGIFLHEMGEHAFLEKLLGTAQYRDLSAQFARLLESGDPWAKAAAERADAAVRNRLVDAYAARVAYQARGTDESLAAYRWKRRALKVERGWRDSERLAYLLENHANAEESERARMPGRPRVFVRRLIVINKINPLPILILAVHPCTAGISD